MKSESTPDLVAEVQHASYAGLFRCIGPACEDICCGPWDIPLDRATYARYMTLADPELAPRIARHVRAIPNAEHDELFAILERTAEGSCTFLAANKHCRMQAAHGQAWLSATCSQYPRSLNAVNGTLEGSLSLSCPEAARFVLLQEDALQQVGDLDSGAFRTDNVFTARERWPDTPMYSATRALLMALGRDRTRPLCERLLLVVELCAALDRALGEEEHDPHDVLARYAATVGTGPSSELAALQPDVARRLELAVVLSDARRRDADCGQRFRDVFAKFVEGIGTPGGGTPADAVERFNFACSNYFAPYVASFPFVLENYIVNWMYQHLFPFGRKESERALARSMRDEACWLVVQFSWVTTLLAGVSGRYGHEFSHAHVVEVVQSFTRAVEHTPQVALDALRHIKAQQLDTVSGLAALLRFDARC